METGVARSRYNQAFSSSIFTPLPTPQGPVIVPAGKRRDLTAAEMFGGHGRTEKELRGAPKTFMPRDGGMSAHERYLQANTSTGVLPNSADLPREAAAVGEAGPREPLSRSTGSVRPHAEEYNEAAAVQNPQQQRHSELSSGLFGRETPQLPDGSGAGGNLVPNDAKWFHVRQGGAGPAGWDSMSHAERSYSNKCSDMFDRASPADAGSQHREAQLQIREEERAGERARRTDPRYSDIFHTRDPAGVEQRARRRPDPEDRIGVYMDWTDSRTELFGERRPQTADAAAARRTGEFQSTMDIMGPTADRPRSSHAYAPPDRRSVVEDNSHKLKGSLSSSASQIHQAHLRSSLAPASFYSEAENSRHWRVVELHVAGLPSSTGSEEMVRELCHGLDIQIVKVLVEMDPVHNLCKGRAKIVVRYNPKRDSVDRLAEKLRASNLSVRL